MFLQARIVASYDRAIDECILDECAVSSSMFQIWQTIGVLPATWRAWSGELVHLHKKMGVAHVARCDIRCTSIWPALSDMLPLSGR